MQNPLPTREPIARTLLLALLIAAPLQADTAAAPRRPNVLFIAVDDLRPELGTYGSVVLSPHIDRLAASGTLFESAYCQEALCMPTRASLLTGRRPDTTRVYAFNRDFRESLPDVVTLPEHFKNHGYHTRAFGKVFHIDDPRSWSEPLWRSKQPEYHTQRGEQILQWIKEDYRRLTFTWELGDGYTKSKRMGGLPWEAPEVPDNALREGDMTQTVLGVIDEVKDKPFFLAVGYHKPHLPFIAPKKYFDLYDHNAIQTAKNPYPPKDAPAFAVYNFNDLRHYYGIPKIGPIGEEQSRDLIHAYYACVSYVDAQIGRLLARLDELDLRRNTIVILWGDHGWQLGEHGIWDKHTNFETSTHVPLIISVPGQKPGRTGALVEFVDIYPSLSELCSLPMPEGLEGTSFAPLVEKPDREWKRAAFSQFPRIIPGHGRGMGYSMRTQRYRFTEWLGEDRRPVAVELYDHQTDPGENVNIAGRAENRSLVEQLRTQLHAGWRAALPR
jgi:arylsulfatase A-like enzyme